MIQLVSLLGALAILAAYAGNQFAWVRTTSLLYVVANAAGAAVLSVVAAVEDQWGFLLLEGVWTIVSVVALVRILSGRPPAHAT
jgi:hypothetical protein